MHGRGCVVVAVLVLACVLPAALACPRSCNCYQANEVHCTFRSLLAVPHGLPAHTQRINLGFNSISRIPENSLAGLKRAELLMLHGNDLHEIPDGVFGDMRSLQVLKLSYNKLKEISSFTFSGLTSLLRLHLDHNLLRHLHPRALLQLPSLRLLRLQGNRLQQLHPHSLCTLSLLNTYYYSTLRHLDLSNNSLATLPEQAFLTVPLLETVVLHANPWRCDCKMSWFLGWSLAHPGLMKCPGGSQCPVCDSPVYLQGQDLLQQTDLPCTSPSISSPGRDLPSVGDPGEIKPEESFREPLGVALFGLSDHQGNSVDLSCSITHAANSPDIPPPDLSQPDAAPIPVALSLSLECPVETVSYESLWRILAYYSDTAVRLEREIMLSKPPALAYQYRQTAETEGYYHTGVKASVKATPHWMLQPAVSLQLNRAQSSAHKVQLILTTRVSVHPDPISHTSSSPSLAVAAPTSLHPWAMILSSHATTAYAAVAGSRVDLSCPLVSSGNLILHWILPDGSKLVYPYSSTDGRVRVSDSGLLLQRTESLDTGLYYCVAKAGSDVDVLPLRLAVEESSVASTGEQVGPSVTALVGDAVTLPCNVSGSPTPDISWVLPDGNTVRHGNAVSGGTSIQSNGSLSMPQASLKDVGNYRCMAVNQYGAESLSMRLVVNPRAGPPFRTSFPRGPQSAAGRSTRIRAPLLQDTILEEGSGDDGGEENPKVSIINRKRPQFPLNRRFPNGHPRRRGPIRGRKPIRKGGAPSQNEPGRNRFHSRQRGSATKQRIDPQKWADLLAKLRQRTTLNSTSPPTQVEEPTLEPVGKETNTMIGKNDGYSSTGSKREEERSDIDRVIGERGINREQHGEVETEGSAFEVSLQEEGLQPIDHVITETQTNTEIRSNTLANMETDSEIKRNKLSETQSSQDGENEADIETQSIPDPEAPAAHVTSKPISSTNEIDLEKERQQNPSPTRFQNNRQRVNPLPNMRPESPWNARRRIGQRRRLINRNRGRPFTPPRPLPDPTSPGSQTVILDIHSNQVSSSTTTTTFPVKVTNAVDHIWSYSTHSESLEVDPPSPTVSNFLSLSLSASSSTSRSLSFLSRLSPPTQAEEDEERASSPTEMPTDTLTLSVDLLDLTENNGSRAPENSPTGRTQTGIHTQGHMPSGKHTDEAILQHVKEIEECESFPTTFPSLVTSSPSPSYMVPSTTTTATATATTTTTAKTTQIPSTTSVTSTLASVSAKESTISAIPSIKHRAPIDSATSTTTTTSLVTAPTSTATAVFIPSSTASVTSTSKTTAIVTTTSTTLSTTVTAPTTASTTMVTTPTRSSMAQTTTSPGTRESSRERPSPGLVYPRVRPVPRVPSHIRPSLDWKSPLVNSIPDSHGTRPIPPSSPILPALPGVPVVRSRPRISDPHIRSVSVPAGSSARLHCEAQGQPAPSVTWTKVSTGVVMTAHARAQRFEVLPNGTFVLHSVQLQDRGTYICSAHSVLGRDRMLTTLEVWSRPPRMKLANYREATIHQGGEIYLDCQADAVPAPLLSWVLPDRSVLTSDSSHHRMTMHTNGTLHISVTLPHDRGVYRCVASNSAGAASASVRVHVSSLPPAIHQPREEHLVLTPGMPVYAHCSARGAPPPTLRWRIPDGTLVRPSQFLHGNLFVLPNGTLHIRKLGPQDAGRYECTASNAVGVERRTVSVRLRGDTGQQAHTGTGAVSTPTQPQPPPSGPLTITNTSPLPSSVPLDRTRTSLLPSPPLSPAFSDPRPPTSHNSPPKNNSAAAATPPTHSLDISQTKPASSQPSNLPSPLDKTKVSPVLNKAAAAAPSFSPSDRSPSHSSVAMSQLSKAHIVSTSPSTTAVHYGGYLQLHCSVSGNPTPTIIWRTPTRKLVDVHFSFDRRMKVHPNGTLLVQAVTEKDAGDYLCIARNKVADDYRLLRVTMATKPAKIDPEQPSNKMVTFGGPLKVDCLSSGQPDPVVSWSLPDGTVVSSMLQGEERGGRAGRLTVFDNGTLLVPAVGIREEGEYTCYAKNHGGQDTMKVKVKVMMNSAPTFADDHGYDVIKVRQGATAVLRCRVKGDSVPTVTWFSPNNRVIPRSLELSYFSERVVVVSDGTLEVRKAQPGDAGNYSCRARSTAGERSRVVGLEVETLYYTPTSRVINRQGSPGDSPANTRHNGDFHQYGPTNAATSRFAINGGVSSGHSNSRVISSVPSSNIDLANSGSKPPSQSSNSVGVHSHMNGFTAQLGHSVISVGVSGNNNIAIKQGNVGIQRNQGDILGSSNLASIAGVSDGWVVRNSNNEVASGRIINNTSSGKVNIKTSDITSSVSNTGTGTGTARGNVLSRSLGQPIDTDWPSGGASAATFNSRVNANSGSASNRGPSNATHTMVSVVTSVKHRAGKGQNVILPCPSHGSPPPRLYWLLPGNGVLPAPYYGSRLTVHRNGSLELRAIRASDGGTLVCVVQGERGETRIQVELSISETSGPRGAGGTGEPGGTWRTGEDLTMQREPAVERPTHSSPVLSLSPRSGDPRVSAGSVHFFNPTEALRPGIPVEETPPQGGGGSLFSPTPPRSAGPALVSETVRYKHKPVVSTRTAALVSIINGENLRLSCQAPHSPGNLQGSFSWTLPRGEVLSEGESAGSGRYTVLHDGTLQVQQTTVFDRGNYICRSTNHGSATVLVVTVPVIVIAYPPRITKGPSPVTYTRPGVAVELPCLTIATPRATVTWETPDLMQLRVTGQARIYGNRYLSAQGSLVIQNPTSRDTGFYRCTAKNVIGADSKATYLHVV